MAQDIILQIYKSADNIRNADSFYSFVWAVAGNVYKQWCKRKVKNQECELLEDLPAEIVDEDDFSDVYLLRRELSLLAEKYRKAVILYYIENKSCLEISKFLSVSESMVKYLLFKSRQLLKEGMSMERNYGEKSYNPKGMSLMFWGKGANHYYHLCKNKISQNILFACYNDKAIAAEVVRKGYVINDANGLRCNVPVFAKGQYQELKKLLEDTTEQIADEAESLMETVTKIMKNHIPVHLKKMAKDMAFLRLFEDAISAPVANLCERKYLLPYSGDSLLLTTYIILK